jgi:fucose permease
MQTNKHSLAVVLPVMFGFFIMGFVDIVGAATHEIKGALNLSSTLAGLLPNFIFIWFLICSVPTGLIMRRIGRKAMVQVSYLFTLVGMLIPLPMLLGAMEINLGVYLATFALLGIGNTIIQVALNPLITNVVSSERLASNITLGQFVKALSSLLGPQIILFCTYSLGNWNWAFVVYAGLTLLAMLWLLLTEIPREERVTGRGVSFGDTFALLKDSFLLRMFVCILLIVGIDVGLNFFIPEIFGKVYGYQNPGNMNTVYFACRALCSFVCAMMLVRMAPRKILLWTMVGSIAACVVMMALSTIQSTAIASQTIFIAMFLPVAFATANVFSIVFSLAIGHRPEKTDQIASLLIMGVAGGGVMTLTIGVMNDAVGIIGGLAVLLACMGYIFFVALSEARK